MRSFITLLLGVSCLLPLALSAQSPAAGARMGGFSPVPLWPENGDTSAYPSQRVFFRPSANEYVVSYPSREGQGQNVVVHIPSHRLVEPVVSTTVTRDSDGKYHYSYAVANGARARTPIDSVMLVLEQRTSGTQGQHPSWPSQVSADRPAGINLNAAGTLRWTSPAGQEIQPGKTASTFTIVSDLAPGFALMSFRGKSDLPELDPLQMSKLPEDVQTQLRACKTLGWDTQVKQVIAPRFDSGAPIEAIAVNFRQGINAIDRTQLGAPKSATLVQVNSLLEAVAQRAATLNDSALESMKAAATDEQKSALAALQLTLRYARPNAVAVQ